MKQSSLDEQEQLGLEMEAQQQENEEEISEDYRPCGSNATNEDSSMINNFNTTANPPLEQSSNTSSILQQRSGKSSF